ncbi:MAG: hypothetical protein ACTS4X_01025 [Candidatus Hodgkinia cicadicola]
MRSNIRLGKFNKLPYVHISSWSTIASIVSRMVKFPPNLSINVSREEVWPNVVVAI